MSVLATALAVAAVTWHIAPGVTNVATDPQLVPPTLAVADEPGTHVWLAPGWWRWDPLKLCTVVVHEVGHNTGHGHSSDPLNVMYPTYVRPYWRCRRALGDR